MSQKRAISCSDSHNRLPVFLNLPLKSEVESLTSFKERKKGEKNRHMLRVGTTIVKPTPSKIIHIVTWSHKKSLESFTKQKQTKNKKNIFEILVQTGKTVQHYAQHTFCL